ncbi:MAG: benzoyl-CoA reductase subunit B [Planctomycetes bacterium]|jgi:benzoyl-CoA reductase subunit B|nr:benzoyl-CoA reductase subunit B [Planctomycetota bacterium]MDP6408685.1 benzoyl-CoA reductase subunit B [Planctomycetota bacterium]
MKSTVIKEPSMVQQKEMISDHFQKLSEAPERGQKVVYTFVPGNLTELMLGFGTLPVHPEINALQSGMRKLSGDYIGAAERVGHSEDVCTYVKCDIGMLLDGNVGPTGKKLPDPDLLLLSYTGCFTFMKWFELLRERYDCPVAMLHVPYQADGEATEEMIAYVTKQLETEVIPKLEEVTGVAYDRERVREHLERSRIAEDDLVAVLEAAKHRPSPIDAYFGGVYYIGPMFTAFRGTEAAGAYYRQLRSEVDARVAAGQGPITPEGLLDEERFRIVVEGPPNWTHFREFWKMFYDEGAVVVASTYTKVGGVYDRGFRHDPDRPLETLAEYCLGCYTNLNLPTRVDMIADYVRDYAADGFLINSIKSCNSFSAGQLVMLRQIEDATGIPGGFIETDLVDPRYFSASNVKNRLESYFQMLQQRGSGLEAESA